MAKILTISGWGQPHDALAEAVPQADHFHYHAYTTVDDCLQDLGKQAANADVVVGWSLGGQLALRAVAGGYMRPKRLVLLAVPFQFIAKEEYPLGMPRIVYDQFRQNFAANPDRTLDKSYALIAKNDLQEDYVSARLKELRDKVKHDHWLRWFDWLQSVDCRGLNFKDFPPTTLVHGDRDVIVEPAHSARFAGLIPHARLDIWHGCGHAPHIHDPERLQRHLTVPQSF